MTPPSSPFLRLLLNIVFPNPVLCIMGRHCGLVVLVGVALLLATGQCATSCKGIDGHPGEAGIPGRNGLGGLKGDKGESGNSGTTSCDRARTDAFFGC